MEKKKKPTLKNKLVIKKRKKEKVKIEKEKEKEKNKILKNQLSLELQINPNDLAKKITLKEPIIKAVNNTPT